LHAGNSFQTAGEAKFLLAVMGPVSSMAWPCCGSERWLLAPAGCWWGTFSVYPIGADEMKLFKRAKVRVVSAEVAGHPLLRRAPAGEREAVALVAQELVDDFGYRVKPAVDAALARVARGRG
jgi:hypothetical protein